MELREKGAEGGRMYWKLGKTDYKWIMAWADDEGRVVQLSAAPRSENGMPFAELGDLSEAVTDQENVAVWNVQPPDELSYRSSRKGVIAARRAFT